MNFGPPQRLCQASNYMPPSKNKVVAKFLCGLNSGPLDGVSDEQISDEANCRVIHAASTLAKITHSGIVFIARRPHGPKRFATMALRLAGTKLCWITAKSTTLQASSKSPEGDCGM